MIHVEHVERGREFSSGQYRAMIYGIGGKGGM